MRAQREHKDWGGGGKHTYNFHAFNNLGRYAVLWWDTQTLSFRKISIYKWKRKSVYQGRLRFFFLTWYFRDTNLSRKLFKTTKNVRQYDFISHFIDNQDWICITHFISWPFRLTFFMFSFVTLDSNNTHIKTTTATGPLVLLFILPSQLWFVWEVWERCTGKMFRVGP